MGEDGPPTSQLHEPLVETQALHVSNIPDTRHSTLVTSSYTMLLVGMSVDKHSGVALRHQSVTYTHLLLHCESRFSTHPAKVKVQPKGCFLLGIHFSSTSWNCPWFSTALCLWLCCDIYSVLLYIHEWHVSCQVFVFSSVPLDCERLVSRDCLVHFSNIRD